ncbi:MAG: DUF883 domain-containing protein [Caulobacteraceae bacterium]
MSANSKASQALDDLIEAAPAAARGQLNQTVSDLTGRAEKVAQETLDTLRSRAEPYVDDLRTRAKPYVDDASERFATAEKYLVERVQKQPVTTTLAVLGIGVLVGLALAGGRQR